MPSTKSLRPILNNGRHTQNDFFWMNQWRNDHITPRSIRPLDLWYAMTFCTLGVRKVLRRCSYAFVLTNDITCPRLFLSFLLLFSLQFLPTIPSQAGVSVKNGHWRITQDWSWSLHLRNITHTYSPGGFCLAFEDYGEVGGGGGPRHRLFFLFISFFLSGDKLELNRL